MSPLSTLALVMGLACGMAPLAQAARIRVKRSAEDVSLLWLGMYGCGSAVWLLYGAAIGSLPLLASQAVAVCCVGVALALAVHARRARRQGARLLPSATSRRASARLQPASSSSLPARAEAARRARSMLAKELHDTRPRR
jgi:uncharacterized protein with PQ loop repeat